MAGIRVPPHQLEALASAVTRLLDNPRSARQIWRVAGARRVREEFSLDAMATRTLALYDEVLPSGASASSDVPRRSLAL